jgi:light-regulated signal transduction histidine kinase (bacteriophytochrome)
MKKGRKGHDEKIAARIEERALQLEEALKELDSFSYSVSHELRAPLRTITGLSQVLITSYSSGLPEEAQSQLLKIQAIALRMDEMVKALLVFSRIGSKEFFPHDTDPAGLARQALEEHQADMNNRQVEILTGDLPRCRAVPSLLRQVFSILISNALKFTRKCSKAVIEIGSSRADDSIVYFVSDNGSGFPDGSKEKLFTLFARLHRDEDYEGIGVGLALARRIIHRHGGSIWAEGKEGEGAVFYFTLPDEEAVGK